MLMMFIAFATIVLSVLLVAGGLRMIAQDTLQTLTDATTKARLAGTLVQRSAYATLWMMIFALSYL